MTALLAIICVLLIAVVVVQIGKVTELAAKIRGEEEVEQANNNRNGIYLYAFMVLFLLGTIVSALYYKNYMLGYGPHSAASTHGGELDRMFDVTLFFTGIVFVITQILLFYFAYKYRQQRGRKASYIPHNNRLEVIWTAVPALVMTFLVVGGLDVWNEVMADVGSDEDFLEVEAMGYQFAWSLRYPGADDQLGARDFELTTATNVLGQDWTDPKNHDDIIANELVLPVNKKIRVRILARDVLHDFYLPQFRVKMDAVPGIPTYFVFTPTKTTEEYRQELRKYPEYNVPDPADPERMRWETFEYELACAELCGRGHWSMRKVVKVVSEEEYEEWLKGQNSYYMTSIRGSEEDPLIGQLLPAEIEARQEEFSMEVEKALADTSGAARTIVLKNLTFETGSANLADVSRFELQNLLDVLKQRSSMRIRVSGHTDNQGDAAANQTLSQQRAEAVVKYLVDNGIAANRLEARGFGDSQPAGDNNTEEGRAQNRRTEFTILNP